MISGMQLQRHCQKPPSSPAALKGPPVVALSKFACSWQHAAGGGSALHPHTNTRPAATNSISSSCQPTYSGETPAALGLCSTHRGGTSRRSCCSCVATSSGGQCRSGTKCQQHGSHHRQFNHHRHHPLVITAAIAPSSGAGGSQPPHSAKTSPSAVVASLSTPTATADPTRPRARLAVFVSGGGSNFKAILAACRDGRIHADVVAVVSDVPSCGGVAFAAEQGIPTFTYPAPKSGAFPGLTTEQLVHQLKEEQGVQYVLLAGFLKLIPLELVRAYPAAMLNIHPALLPAFGGKGYYGARVHTAVIASGARFSGATIHFVDEEFDSGTILAQRIVPVLPTDSPAQLAARVLVEEHKLYPEAVAALVDGRITWRKDGVPVVWTAS